MKDHVKLAGYAGLVFVVLTVIAIALIAGGEPDPDATAQEIRTFFEDDRSTILLAVVLGLIGTVLFLSWAIVARRVVGRGATGDTAGTMLLVGAIVGAVSGLAGDLVATAPLWIEGALADIGDDVLVYSWGLRFLFYGLSMVGIVLIGAAIAAAALRDRLLPSYVGWVGALVAILAVVGLFLPLGTAPAMVGFLGYLGLLVVVLLASITMARGATEDDARIYTPA
jgi:hypothetical protein